MLFLDTNTALNSDFFSQLNVDKDCRREYHLPETDLCLELFLFCRHFHLLYNFFMRFLFRSKATSS